MDQPLQRPQDLTASFLHDALHDARPFCIPGCPHVSRRVLPSRALPSWYPTPAGSGGIRLERFEGGEGSTVQKCKNRINVMIDWRTTAHAFIAVRRVIRTAFLFPPRRHVQLKKRHSVRTLHSPCGIRKYFCCPVGNVDRSKLPPIGI